MFSSNTSGPGVATDPQFNYVTMLLHGNGTNGAQNNTFLDSSTNNFTITRNGNTTQGTFSPYGSNWSNYFDGTGDYLSFTKQTTTSAFTCECWFYRGEDVSGYHIVFSGNNLGSVNADNAQLSVSNAGAVGLTLAGTAVIAQTGTAVIKNQWNHIAWVRSGTSCAIFVNGSRIATGTSSSALNIVSVGTYLSGYEPNGYVSNARINTTAVYDPSLTTCTVPTAPLTAITGTYLLTCQSNRFVDNSASPLTITVNGNPSVQRFSPFNPTAPYAAGTDGGSGYFDGTGDSLVISSGNVAQFGTGDFTMEAWVYLLSHDGDESAVMTGGINFGIYTQPNVNIATNGTVNLNGAQSTSNTVPLNTWTHIAVSRNSGTSRIFINGVQGSSASNTSNYNGVGAMIGIRSNGSSDFGSIHGYISNVRYVNGTGLYTSAFTPPTAPPTAITNTSLLLNFTNGGIIDNAMMNDLETVGNAQISTSVSKFGGGSMAFDGSGDYLVQPYNQGQNFGTGNFTIEGWFYLNSLANAYYVLGGTWSVENSNEWLIQIQNNGSIRFLTTAGTSFYSAGITTGTWYHFAAVRSGTTVTLYINGTSVGSYTNSNSIGSTAVTTFWGIQNASSWPWNGYIDDLRITKGYARYTANFTPPSAPFPDN